MSIPKRSKNHEHVATAPQDILSIIDPNPPEFQKRVGQDNRTFIFNRSHSLVLGGLIVTLLLGMGIMASNGWLPLTDPMSGKKIGWFGKELPKNALSSWNPLADPSPTPTPQLSKEYIYAGSRLLAVEDANANAAPPADLAVWRPTDHVWYVLGGPGSAQTFFPWGAAGDIPVAGDFDGDGKTDFSVYRPSTGAWWIMPSSTNAFYSVPFGVACTPPTGCDKPTAADFDGDSKSDVAVYRSSDGTWYYIRSSDQVVVQLQFGVSTDTPVPADYDGDGKADITVWRPSDHTFYTLRSSDLSYQYAAFASTANAPVSADYDGDGKANYAVRDGDDWIIQNANGTLGPRIPWGTSGDVAVQNDYDGDGKCDIAVWRGSTGDWTIRRSGSNNSPRTEHWGASGDTPVPAFYRR